MPTIPAGPVLAAPPTPTIYVINSSSAAHGVSNADAATMTEACNLQLPALAANYGRTPWPVAFAPDAAHVPPGGYVITIMDTLDDAEALGYHTEEGHKIYGVVGTKAVLDQGAHALTGAYAVSTVLSHEVLELFVDPTCAAWCDSGAGWLMSYECCDPVQSGLYSITTRSGAHVDVSDWVTSSFFDPGGVGPFDALGVLKRPFSIDKGGYAVTMREGRQSQRFGEEVPEWWREVRRRSATRVGSRADGTNAPATTGAVESGAPGEHELPAADAA